MSGLWMVRFSNGWDHNHSWRYTPALWKSNLQKKVRIANLSRFQMVGDQIPTVLEFDSIHNPSRLPISQKNIYYYGVSLDRSPALACKFALAGTPVCLKGFVGTRWLKSVDGSISQELGARCKSQSYALYLHPIFKMLFCGVNVQCMAQNCLWNWPIS